MYLLRGSIVGKRMAVTAIYDLDHPRNAGIPCASGVVAEDEPTLPIEEGYTYCTYYNIETQAYEYEAIPLPEPPAPPTPASPSYEELAAAVDIYEGGGGNV